MEYLEVFLETNDIEDIESWLRKNVVLSYYEEFLPEITLLAPQIIEKISPVFNVNKNPGNLFQYTLKSKLDEYYEKYPEKKLPF